MFLESSPGFQTSKTAHRRFYQFLAISLLTIATSLATGCAGISSAAPISSTKNPSVQMNLSPASADVASGGQIQFSATLTSTRDTGVMWHANGGTITKTGLFTAPTVSSATKVTVVATSVADNQLIATSEVTVSPLTKLSIQTSGLPAGTAGASYLANLKVVGGVPTTGKFPGAHCHRDSRWTKAAERFQAQLPTAETLASRLPSPMPTHRGSAAT